MLKICSVREFCDVYCWSYSDPRLSDVQSVILTDTQEDYLGFVCTDGTYCVLNSCDVITACDYDSMMILLCNKEDDFFNHIMYSYNYELNAYEFFTDRFTLRIINCENDCGVMHVIYTQDGSEEYIRYWTRDSLYEYLVSLFEIEA